MADSMYYINNTTPRTEVYVGESTADLAKMPTTTTVGQEPYKKALAPLGSIAKIYTNDGIKYYILKSTGWKDYTSQMSGGSGSGSGGSGSGTITDDMVATDDEFGDVMNDLFP